MSRMPPCYQCTTRHPACHDTCVAYRDWAEETRKRHQADHKMDEVDVHLMEFFKIRGRKWKR